MTDTRFPDRGFKDDGPDEGKVLIWVDDKPGTKFRLQPAALSRRQTRGSCRMPHPRRSLAHHDAGRAARRVRGDQR